MQALIQLLQQPLAEAQSRIPPPSTARARGGGCVPSIPRVGDPVLRAATKRAMKSPGERARAHARTRARGGGGGGRGKVVCCECDSAPRRRPWAGVIQPPMKIEAGFAEVEGDRAGCSDGGTTRGCANGGRRVAGGEPSATSPSPALSPNTCEKFQLKSGPPAAILRWVVGVQARPRKLFAIGASLGALARVPTSLSHQGAWFRSWSKQGGRSVLACRL